MSLAPLLTQEEQACRGGGGGGGGGKGAGRGAREGRERVTEGIFLGQDFLTVLTSTMKHSVRFFSFFLSFFPLFSFFSFLFSAVDRSISTASMALCLLSTMSTILCLPVCLQACSSSEIQKRCGHLWSHTCVHLKQNEIQRIDRYSEEFRLETKFWNDGE